MLRIFSRLLVVLSLVPYLTAGNFWDDRSFTKWSQKEAIKLLVDSPWSSTQTVRYRAGSMVTGPSPTESQASCNDCRSEAETVAILLSDPEMPGPTSGNTIQQRKYFIRFRTATPVRMALARLAMLTGAGSEVKAQEYVENTEFPGQIVVVVEASSEGETYELDLVSLDSIKEHAYLLLKKSKNRIPIQQYVSPSQFGGTRAFFIFPREQNGEELISLKEKEVRFVCRLSTETKIERKFKLKEMVYKGVLDL